MSNSMDSRQESEMHDSDSMHPAAPCAGTSDRDPADDMAQGRGMPSPSSQRGDGTIVNTESHNFVRLAMHIIL